METYLPTVIVPALNQVSSLLKPNKSWLKAVVQSTVAMSLAFTAFFVSDFLNNKVTPGFPSAYVFWFALCLIPFLLFARSRGMIRFDCWDAVALVPFLGCISIATSLSWSLRHEHGFWIFITPVAAIVCSPFVRIIRRRLPETPKGSSIFGEEKVSDTDMVD